MMLVLLIKFSLIYIQTSHTGYVQVISGPCWDHWEPSWHRTCARSRPLTYFWAANILIHISIYIYPYRGYNWSQKLDYTIGWFLYHEKHLMQYVYITWFFELYRIQCVSFRTCFFFYDWGVHRTQARPQEKRRSPDPS